MLCYGEPCPSCRGITQEAVENTKKAAEIPLSFSDKRYTDFMWGVYCNEQGNTIDTHTHQKAVKSFIGEFELWEAEGYGLYIYSATKGSGKTFLASVICNELMSKYNTRTKFVSATSLLDIAKSGIDNSSSTYERDPIQLLCDCRVLVIDDIGQKKTGGEWMSEILFRIIDARITGKKSTIFTSNLNVGELPIDYRIIDRIYQRSHPLHLPEFNVRAREALDKKLSFLKDRGIISERGGLH